MRLRTGFVILAAVAAASACTEPDDAAPASDTAAVREDARVSREDSAGVEIVTTREPLWERDAGWSLAPVPRLAVGDSALGLRQVVGLARLASGAVAVGDAGLGAIVVIDSAGGVERRIDARRVGRPFRQLFWIAAAGDTVLAYDLAENRLVRVPPEGNASAVALRTVSRSSFTALRPIDRFGGGDFLAVSGGSVFPFPGEEYEVVQDSAVLLRYAANGRVRDTLGIVPWSESFGVVTGSGRRRMTVPLPRPYGRATSAAAAGDLLYVGTGERFEITVHDTTGRLVRSVRVPMVLDSLPREAVDSYQARVRRRIERGDSGLADRALAGALERAPYPATVPAYERVMVAPDGVLWVLDAAPMTRESVTWRVFDADGRWLGVVPMPARLVVHEIGQDYVLGVWSGDDGGKEIRLYEIVRPAADSR